MPKQKRKLPQKRNNEAGLFLRSFFCRVSSYSKKHIGCASFLMFGKFSRNLSEPSEVEIAIIHTEEIFKIQIVRNEP